MLDSYPVLVLRMLEIDWLKSPQKRVCEGNQDHAHRSSSLVKHAQEQVIDKHCTASLRVCRNKRAKVKSYAGLMRRDEQMVDSKHRRMRQLAHRSLWPRNRTLVYHAVRRCVDEGIIWHSVMR